MRTRSLPALILVGLLAFALFIPALALAADSGSITLHKTGKSNAALVGVDFSLYFDNGNDIFEANVDTFITNGSTDATGKLTFSDLALGSYWLVETNAPQGYRLTPPVETAIPGTNQSMNVQIEIPDQVVGGSPTPQASNTPHPSKTPKTPPTSMGIFPGVSMPVGILLLSAALLLFAGLAWLIVPHRRVPKQD